LGRWSGQEADVLRVSAPPLAAQAKPFASAKQQALAEAHSVPVSPPLTLPRSSSSFALSCEEVSGSLPGTFARAFSRSFARETQPRASVAFSSPFSEPWREQAFQKSLAFPFARRRQEAQAR
jgi:hypothetical protein